MELSQNFQTFIGFFCFIQIIYLPLQRSIKSSRSLASGLTNRALLALATVVSTMRKQYYKLQKIKVMVHHIYYIKFALQFADMQISELVSVFNREVGLKAWSSMRAYHDRALIDELKNRSVNLSAIINDGNINFAHKVFFDISSNKLIPIK